jgi:hypothetical protein
MLCAASRRAFAAACVAVASDFCAETTWSCALAMLDAADCSAFATLLAASSRA